MGDSHNINNGKRAADGSGDTLGMQEKAPSRGMRYLIKISQINFMLPQETHHHLLVRIHFETRTRREKKAPWIYGSRVGAWLGPFSVLQYATADGCGGQSPGNRRRSSEHDHMHACLVHTIKNLHRRRKGHAHLHSSFS